MSSAHRPTWAAALAGTGLREGSTSAPTQQFSARDLPAHGKLKQRQAQDLFFQEGKAEKEMKQLAPPDDADIEFSEHEDEAESNEGDDEDELMRELERIKRERAEEAAKRASEEEEAVLRANPLLSITTKTVGAGASVIKRKWNDETVFKNHVTMSDNKPAKRFINDTTRSDFHRRFLDKYIR